jgi:hypothetical protein
MGMSPAERREALRRRKDHSLSVVLLGWCGAQLNRANRFAYLSYVPDAIREYGAVPGFRDIVSRWTRGNERRNAGDLVRLLFLLYNGQQVVSEGVAGDFAELGVHMGHSAAVLADLLAQKRSGTSRKLYLFDTFSGFDSRDLEGVDVGVAPIYGDTSLDAVRQLVRNEDLCIYCPGYFPDTASAVDHDTSFAFVHLDCDLYEPTAAALRFFYPRLSPGATVVIHDYSSGHWPGVTQAVDEFLAGKPERIVLIPDKSGSAVFRRMAD